MLIVSGAEIKERSITSSVLKTFHRTVPGQLVVEGTNILLLPASLYNYAIGGEPHFVDFHPEKTILHVKESGKRDMQDYWNSYLKPKTSS